MESNLDLGRALRDEGAQLALDNAGDSWHDMATALALKYFSAAGKQGALFEDARAFAMSCGISQPPSPNAWGAVALAMSKKKMIIRTGAMLPSKTAKSHARVQPVWRLTNI